MNEIRIIHICNIRNKTHAEKLTPIFLTTGITYIATGLDGEMRDELTDEERSKIEILAVDGDGSDEITPFIEGIEFSIRYRN